MRCSCILVLVLALLLQLSFPLIAHPLDPLTEDEIRASVQILKQQKLLGDGWYLQLLSQNDPPKALVLNAAPTSRQSFGVLIHAKQNKRFECVLDLKANKILTKREITRGQVAVLDAEYVQVGDALKKSTDVKAALAKRGISDLAEIYVDVWAVGDPRKLGKRPPHRFLRGAFYHKKTATNPYGRPIEGLTALYDATDSKVVDVYNSSPLPLPKTSQDFFDADWITTERGPLHLKNAAGASGIGNENIVRNGNEISWQGWNFHFQIHPREGLVLSQVGIEERSILYRAALSEMVVPYADPDSHWLWRAAFDQGEYGLGVFSQPLVLGVHVPKNAIVLDAVFPDTSGEIRRIPNAVAIYERDGGIAWSHQDTNVNKSVARRGRQLVITNIFTVANYDYGFSWIFHQDGTMEAQMMLTGILAAKGTDLHVCGRCQKLAGDSHGVVIDHNLLGVMHQHFFNFRLDFAVDGDKNSVAEVEVRPVTDKKSNPAGNAFALHETVLKSERQAARDLNFANARRWWIFNPNKQNRLGHFSGYMLEPGTNAMPMARPGSSVRQRAGFLDHHLWVTQYDPTHMHAAGNYPSQNHGEGLPVWTKRNANLVNKNVVVWYTVGVTHIPSAEEWPVMSAAHTGFHLKPMGFFDHNRALHVAQHSPG